MYEKQTWENGDVITEDKLNHIEDGIGDEIHLIHLYVAEEYDDETEEYSYTVIDTDMTFEEYFNLDTPKNNYLMILNIDSNYDGEEFWPNYTFVLDNIGNSSFACSKIEMSGTPYYAFEYKVESIDDEWSVSKFKGTLSNS